MVRWSMLAVLVLLLTSSTILADDLADDVVASEAGDFDAMLRVGLAYLSDKDPANNDDGIKWLEISSAGGNVVAYYNLGARYQDGKVVKQNANKALMYLTLAAELGEIRAMNRLAGIYYIGELVPGNDILAVKWGLCAAGLGSKTAQNNMEQMREHLDERSAVLGAKAAKAWSKQRFKKSKQ